MKNYLLLLLIIFSITTQAQTYQNPTFGKLTLKTNTLSTSTAKIITQETDGQINYINALSLPVPTSVINAIKQKADLSTGLIKNGLISANGDPTKFNITAGIGIISNFDDPENPISTIINFPAFNSITPTYLTTGNITYVAINSTPAVVTQATPFTPEQRRSLIVLGATIHSNLTTINVLNNISAPTNADTNQLHDFMEAVGALNITGNKYTANGANLQLNKSAGVLFKLGSNFAVDWKNPHEIAQAGGTAITFRYRTQNGTESADMTSISPNLYDLNNVLTTVPNNKFTIQTVTVFQTGLTRIQYGQNIYDDLQAAKNALLTRDYVVENNIKENGVTRAYIIVKKNTTSLQNVSDAYISEAQKFGGVASGGVALTLANIVTALGYTPENVANKSDSFTVSSSTTYSSTKALVDGLATKQNTLTNPVTGAGTSGIVPVFTGTSTLGNSVIQADGNSVGIGFAPQTYAKLIVDGGTGGFAYGVDITSPSNGSIFRDPAGYLQLGSNQLKYVGEGGYIINAQGTTVPIVFSQNSAEKARISTGGRFVVGGGSDNGIDGAQFGTQTASGGNASLPNQFATFGQVFTSPTFTGVPSAPTAAAGTNTTQIASTAFVLANVNANALTITGDQNFTGYKTGISSASTPAGVTLTNNNTGSGSSVANFTNSATASDNGSSALRAINSNTGSNTAAVQLINESTGLGGFFKNLSTGNGLFFENWSTGIGSVYNSLTASTGDLIRFEKQGVLTGKVNSNGEITAPKLTMTGTIELKSYTVSTLPTGVQGMLAYVTDALAPTYMATVVGGGTVVIPVFYDGVSWKCH